jgi:hypothetical protein
MVALVLSSTKHCPACFYRRMKLACRITACIETSRKEVGMRYSKHRKPQMISLHKVPSNLLVAVI